MFNVKNFLDILDLNFADVKEEITQAIKEKLSIKEDFTIIEGFKHNNFFPCMGIAINALNIITVSVIGKNSGQIYNFSLIELFPHIKNEDFKD